MIPDDRQEKLDRAYDLAFEYERTNGSCPQCVLAAVQEVLGVECDEAFRASYGLAGGGGLMTTGTCGALVGALLLVGLKYGRPREHFKDGQVPKCFKHSRTVVERFVEEFGGTTCAEVQTKIMGRSYDLWNGRGYSAFLEAGGHEDKCTRVAGTAAKIVTEFLLDLEEPSPSS